VNATGYIISFILVLLVLRQIRETRLGLTSLVLPVVLVAGAAAYYLRSVPTAGNDIALDLTLAATGAALGIMCALATRMRRGSDGVALARAGWLAAILWIAGIGCRMGFAFFDDHGAGPAIARFSVAHRITSADAWVAALVIMALAEVITRLIVLRLRARALPATAGQIPGRAPADAPADALT
jgi:peptidoglycan/LPS O-acetylase OafA/YrhL